MTTKPPLYPLLLQPALHVKVWGGRRLTDVMNKNLPTSEPYGEAWELHDTAAVALCGTATGTFAGTFLFFTLEPEAAFTPENPATQNQNHQCRG